MNYLIDILLLTMAAHFTTYMLYGRLTGRPLVGGYKPGSLGYEAFRKIIRNNKYLGLSIIATIFFAINAVLGARKIIQESSSHSILIVAPVLVVSIFIVLFAVMPLILGKKR